MQPDDNVLFGDSDDDFGEVADGDSGILAFRVESSNLLTITEDGNSLVVAFKSTDVPDDVHIAEYRVQLYEQLKSSECTIVRFDLTGIHYLPSGLLGLLISVKHRGLDVEVANASTIIRESLAETRLDQFIKILN